MLLSTEALCDIFSSMDRYNVERLLPVCSYFENIVNYSWRQLPLRSIHMAELRMRKGDEYFAVIHLTQSAHETIMMRRREKTRIFTNRGKQYAAVTVLLRFWLLWCRRHFSVQGDDGIHLGPEYKQNFTIKLTFIVVPITNRRDVHENTARIHPQLHSILHGGHTSRVV
jgi:hypothetical protein